MSDQTFGAILKWSKCPFFTSEEPAMTGEIVEKAAYDCSSTTQQERKRVIYEAINAALDSERERLEKQWGREGIHITMERLTQELTAVQEKVQTLVDAGNAMRRTMYSNDSDESKTWNAAVAKVEEGK